jgi:hypothetical protein
MQLGRRTACRGVFVRVKYRGAPRGVLRRLGARGRKAELTRSSGERKRGRWRRSRRSDGRWLGGKTEVREDGANGEGIGDEGEQTAAALAVGAAEYVNHVDASGELSPRVTRSRLGPRFGGRRLRGARRCRRGRRRRWRERVRTEGVVCVGVLCGSMLGWRNAGCSLRWVNVALICVLLLRCRW